MENCLLNVKVQKSNRHGSKLKNDIGLNRTHNTKLLYFKKFEFVRIEAVISMETDNRLTSV